MARRNLTLVLLLLTVFVLALIAQVAEAGTGVFCQGREVMRRSSAILGPTTSMARLAMTSWREWAATT